MFYQNNGGKGIYGFMGTGSQLESNHDPLAAEEGSQGRVDVFYQVRPNLIGRKKNPRVDFVYHVRAKNLIRQQTEEGSHHRFCLPGSRQKSDPAADRYVEEGYLIGRKKNPRVDFVYHVRAKNLIRQQTEEGSHHRFCLPGSRQKSDPAADRYVEEGSQSRFCLPVSRQI
jgi:hypothetical protein